MGHLCVCVYVCLRLPLSFFCLCPSLCLPVYLSVCTSFPFHLSLPDSLSPIYLFTLSLTLFSF